MLRLSIIIATAALLSACSTTRISSSHYYRAPGETASNTITGSVLQEKALFGYDFNVTVTANGSTICKGPAPGRLTGKLGDKPVECECMATTGDLSCAAINTSFACATDQKIRCFVFVDGDRAADLSFQ